MHNHLSLLSWSPMFFVCFVFKRFCLTFKVVHVHDSISFVILYLYLVFTCLLYLLFACLLCLWLCLSA